MDWHRVSIADYVSAVLGVPSVGRGMGQFINYLVEEFKIPYDNVHLVGFSLGAHVVGIAGRETGGKVARVTGDQFCFEVLVIHMRVLSITNR